MPIGVFARLDRQLLGDSVVVRDAAGVRERSAHVAEPRPNAPLLIRIVRTPYALSTSHGQRTAYRAAPDGIGHRPTPFTLRPSRFVTLPDEGA